MADYNREPWMDPSNNQVAADGMMTGEKVSPVIIVGSDGTVGETTTTTNKGTTSSRSSVASSTTSAILAASNADRITVTFVNNTDYHIYLGYGSTVSSTDFSYKLYPGDVLISDDFTGDIYGVSDTDDAAQFIYITEVTK